jgi:hypothetical protein
MHVHMLLRTLAILVALTATATAQPKKKYHFDLAAVNAKPEIKPDVAKSAVPRIQDQAKKAFETHPQLVAKLDDAPDWKTAADAYRKYLAKKGIAGAFHVTVDVTDAFEELQPVTDKANTQRLVVKVSVHLLGETMPGRTMAFTGDGSATIKQEIGKKLSERDRKFAWDDAAKAAIDDAMVTVFKQLAAGVAPKSQKK